MNKETIDINEERKKLVLARLKTLNPDSKIMLGSKKKISVDQLIDHVEKEDEFGKKVVEAQMNMLKVLTDVA